MIAHLIRTLSSHCRYASIIPAAYVFRALHIVFRYKGGTVALSAANPSTSTNATALLPMGDAPQCDLSVWFALFDTVAIALLLAAAMLAAIRTNQLRDEQCAIYQRHVVRLRVGSTSAGFSEGGGTSDINDSGIITAAVTPNGVPVTAESKAACLEAFEFAVQVVDSISKTSPATLCGSKVTTAALSPLFTLAILAVAYFSALLGVPVGAAVFSIISD